MNVYEFCGKERNEQKEKWKTINGKLRDNQIYYVYACYHIAALLSAKVLKMENIYKKWKIFYTFYARGKRSEWERVSLNECCWLDKSELWSSWMKSRFIFALRCLAWHDFHKNSPFFISARLPAPPRYGLRAVTDPSIRSALKLFKNVNEGVIIPSFRGFDFNQAINLISNLLANGLHVIVTSLHRTELR